MKSPFSEFFHHLLWALQIKVILFPDFIFFINLQYSFCIKCFKVPSHTHTPFLISLLVYLLWQSPGGFSFHFPQPTCSWAFYSILSLGPCLLFPGVTRQLWDMLPLFLSPQLGRGTAFFLLLWRLYFIISPLIYLVVSA